jgi:hypothetical protein
LPCLQIILIEAHERQVKKITIFSDNGSGFHSVDQILFQSSIAKMYSIEWIGNFYPAGEGKSECDRMTARASKYRYQYMLAGHDFNGDINTLVDALALMDNCTIDIIDIDISKAHDISWEGKIEAADRDMNMHNTSIREYKFDENSKLYARTATNLGEWQHMQFTFTHIQPTKRRSKKKQNNTQSACQQLPATSTSTSTSTTTITNESATPMDISDNNTQTQVTTQVECTKVTSTNDINGIANHTDSTSVWYNRIRREAHACMKDSKVLTTQERTEEYYTNKLKKRKKRTSYTSHTHTSLHQHISKKH